MLKKFKRVKLFGYIIKIVSSSLVQYAFHVLQSDILSVLGLDALLRGFFRVILSVPDLF